MISSLFYADIDLTERFALQLCPPSLQEQETAESEKAGQAGIVCRGKY